MKRRAAAEGGSSPTRDSCFPLFRGEEDGYLIWDEVASDVCGRTIDKMELDELAMLFHGEEELQAESRLTKTKFTFLRQLLNIAASLESMKIIHRDIKPENILFDTSTKNLKVIDFGSAKVSAKL